MNNKVVLVNYRIPVSLKNEFEDACRRLYIPMTAQVNLLMREFVHRQKNSRTQSDDLEEPVSFYNCTNDML